MVSLATRRDANRVPIECKGAQREIQTRTREPTTTIRPGAPKSFRRRRNRDPWDGERVPGSVRLRREDSMLRSMTCALALTLGLLALASDASAQGATTLS